MKAHFRGSEGQVGEAEGGVGGYEQWDCVSRSDHSTRHARSEPVVSNNSAWRPSTLGVGLRGSIVITEEATNPFAAPDAAVLRLNPNAVD